ncbi:U3 small nucleolar RNA-interacting protein 2 [Ctenocephalides felis]|uniref:U3 small nucleolar RNA-interacting protein 2 n=1 Tax=Ctenocephalides felis TaxID=7515 RepID=UPI000E6E1ECA|nr:U3 small nucleolar RNA-interacting protein 2 [Ctenocephalides felis]
MSFFIKGKPRNNVNRKFDKNKKGDKKAKIEKFESKQKSDSEIDSDIEYSDVPDKESEDEIETPQEKRLRLAKKYLEEIEREEKLRAEDKEVDDNVTQRLKDDYLEQSGRLRRTVADSFVGFETDSIKYLKNVHKLPVTCLCLSSDNKYIFSGGKDSCLVKWCVETGKKLLALTYKPKSDSSEFRHKTIIMAVAITQDSKFLASADRTKDIQIWDPENLKHLHTFRGHRGIITGLVFRKDTHQLYSASEDRSMKVWSLDEMSYVESMFGHQASITSIDALSRERAITSGGQDNTIRIWKIVEESQLIFNGHSSSIDCVKLVNEEYFVSGGQDGQLSLWGAMKKKPLFNIPNAHGVSDSESNWITSVAALVNTDLVASGSCDGFIRLWKLADNFRSMTQVLEIPVEGFVNALAFTNDGKHIIAGIGREHKLGRWWTNKNAKNLILIIPLMLKT